MAVYTEVADEDLDAFVAGYGLGEILSLKGIADGVQNTNYLLRISGGPLILTLFEDCVELADLPFFFGLMEHLAGDAISCPLALRDSQGRCFSELAGRPAALITFLDGLSVRRPKVPHCEAVGAALARLHLAGSSFEMSRANELGMADWQPLYGRFAPRVDEISDGLGAVIEAELAALQQDWPARPGPDGTLQWPAGIATGIIHADLFPDNVFFRGEALTGIIDFYNACTDALAYDIAVCLNAWCFDADHAFNFTKGRALLRGYQRVRKIAPAERAVLPVLARGAALRFLLSRGRDWLNVSAGALVSPKDPMDYLRRLRFHQKVNSAREYGLED